MNRLALLLTLISINVFSQEQVVDTLITSSEISIVQKNKDSLPLNSEVTAPNNLDENGNQIENSNITINHTDITETVLEESNYTNKDLEGLNELILAGKYNSPLVANKDYVVSGIEETDTLDYRVSTVELKERLAIINATTPFNMEYNPSLERVINSYVKRRRKYYPALMARAQFYFPIFEEKLSQYNIPLEMKYLAIVESALHPKAKSRVGATGLWQFMYGTGKQFKLAINSYVDERSDPVKSTIAACEYLKMLYEMFDDWDLALAAYNSGPGNVNKAIKRSGGQRNYWNIRRYLPRETAGYVPAFYATMYVFKYVKELNIPLEKPAYYFFQTDTIQVKRAVSFKNITDKTGISKEVLELLNPQYKLNIVPYFKNKRFTVRIPLNKTVKFLDNEQDVYALALYDESLREKPLMKYVDIASKMKSGRIRYKVRSGDFLGKIARRYGVKIKQIKRWNNIRGTNLSIGQRLYLYPKKI